MPRLPLLDTEVNNYIQSRRTRDPKRRVIGADEKQAMIWGWSRGWSANRIATAIKISERVIWNYKARVVRSPAVVFHELSLYIQMDAHKFQCRICGEIRTTRTDLLWFLTLICFCVSPRWSRGELHLLKTFSKLLAERNGLVVGF